MTASPRPRHAGLKVIGVLKLISGVTALPSGSASSDSSATTRARTPTASLLTWASTRIITIIHEADQRDHGDRPRPPPRHRVRHVLLRRAAHRRGHRPDPRLPLGRIPRHRRHRLAHPLRDLRDLPETHPRPDRALPRKRRDRDLPDRHPAEGSAAASPRFRLRETSSGPAVGQVAQMGEARSFTSPHGPRLPTIPPIHQEGPPVTPETSPPDPAVILDLLEAFRRSKVMFAAVSLGIFDTLEDRPRSAAELAEALSLHPDALTRLLDSAIGLKLLERGARSTRTRRPLRRTSASAARRG